MLFYVPPDDAALPIFPLSNVVLFPAIQTPLHIFEARYRQMVEHALAGDRRIGMVTVEPERVLDMSGDPPVFAIGSAVSVPCTRCARSPTARRPPRK